MSYDFEQKLNVLEKIKHIPALPSLNAITTKMADAYFEVKSGCTSALCGRKRSDFGRLGLRKANIKDFVNAGYQVEETDNYSLVRCQLDGVELTLSKYGSFYLLSMEALCAIAENHFSESPVVREFRSRIAQTKDKDELHVTEILPSNDLTVAEYTKLKEATPNLRTFTSETFGSIRTIMRDGEPWFVAADVCKALEIGESHVALRRLDEDEKGRFLIPTLGGKQEMSIINEPGLYSLVLGSRKPEAKAFKRWITHDVIPSLRKHGAYIVGQESMSELELIAEALLASERISSERQRKIEHLEAEKHLLLANARDWDYPSIINALVRSYANRICPNHFEYAWNEFYRQLKYKHHIDIKKRRGSDGSGRFIHQIQASEFPIAAQVAISMCEAAQIDCSRVINETNVKKIGA